MRENRADGRTVVSLRAKTEVYAAVPIHGGLIIARKHARLVFAPRETRSGSTRRNTVSLSVAICENILKR